MSAWVRATIDSSGETPKASHAAPARSWSPSPCWPLFNGVRDTLAEQIARSRRYLGSPFHIDDCSR
jgi:hypothetical protein